MTKNINSLEYLLEISDKSDNNRIVYHIISKGLLQNFITFLSFKYYAR